MGPRIDPREVEYVAELSQYGVSAFIVLILFGLTWHFRKSEVWYSIFACAAIVTLVTTPWVGLFNDAVIGAYPTVDKEGSLLFYLDGVHQRALFSPIESLNDPAYQLIGVHLGHLWIVEFFDLFLSPFAAFNAHILLNLFLNSIVGYFFFRCFNIEQCTALTLGAIIGLQLHVFRDIHWYTIEKSTIFAPILFWALIEKIHRRKSTKWWLLTIVYLLSTWLNFYWGIVLAILGICYFLRSILSVDHNYILWKSLIGCGVVGLLLGGLQWRLMSGEAVALGPELNFIERASLDNFSLHSLDWNRMGFWRPINPIIVLLALLNIVKGRVEPFILSIAVLFTGLSMGPFLFDEYLNPIYFIFQTIPGMSRFAKPEVFFLMTYLCLALMATNIKWNKPLLGFTIALWLIGLYSSDGFPYISEYIEGNLSIDWEDRIGK